MFSAFALAINNISREFKPIVPKQIRTPKPPPPLRDKVCVSCGKPFQTRSHNGATCSVECRKAEKKARRNSSRVLKLRTANCVICGTEFSSSVVNKMTCGDDCAKAYARSQYAVHSKRRHDKLVERLLAEQVAAVKAENDALPKRRYETMAMKFEAHVATVKAEHDACPKRNCVLCGKEYPVKLRAQHQKYCGTRCQTRSSKARERQKAKEAKHD
jgi:predicted nucleic acid-binding Zn ribbon protein